ncbi:MAG TPA: DbpA RNA binding domain-containing protein [Gemmatimonadales bacterium]|nr:DbpA RNA binding domain-containing protein [Gemmatimonadales bacterium]
MPDFAALHLTGPVADNFAALGWSPADARVREVVPTVARGHNLVAVIPPAAAWAGPALAGLLARLAAGEGRHALLLAPEAELAEWGAAAARLARGSPVRVQVAHGTARASRRLRERSLELLVASPESAAALVRQSALRADALAAVVLAWPDRSGADDAIAGLMQDLPKEAQRVVLTSDPARAPALGERYARKAMTAGVPPAESAPAPPAGPVRTVSVAWRGRIQAAAEVLELLDPESLTVWTADRAYHAELADALPAGDPAVRVVTGDAPPSEVVVGFDPPDPDRLRQLLAAGREVVLLVPPGAEGYVERIAAPRRPLRLPGPADRAALAGAERRAAVARTIEAGRAEGALLALAPLLERYDAAAVAAALYQLWTGAGAPAAAPAPVPPEPTATARVFVGVGREDGATASDLVAVLTKQLRVPREQIGRIELRDGFSLVELPAGDAERIAQGLNGTTIRRKRVLARLDRGKPAAPARGPRAPRRGGREPTR